MLASLSACRRDVPEDSSYAQGTLIELSSAIIGDTPSLTKSVITTDSPFGTGATALSKGTSLYLVLRSESRADLTKDALYTRTIGFSQEAATLTSNTVKFATEFGRFWEDSYSRNSLLSVYSVCVPGYYLDASVYEQVTPSGTKDSDTPWTIGSSSVYNNIWNTENGATTIAWPLRSSSASSQTGGFVDSQDLCFSNNVTESNRVSFDASLKKFGSGKLVFYHALSKVTFRVKKGEGFQQGEAFDFTNDDENIVLKGVNVRGIFDIKEGEFDASSVETGTISEFKNRGSDDTYAYILDALMLPGTNLDENVVGNVHFTIGYNLYQLSMQHLMGALAGQTLADGTPALDDGKLRAGVHYIFDMTVGKKKMDSFTASVVPWESVTAAETTPTNARIEVSLVDNGVKQTGTASFDLYRAANVSPAISDVFESFAWNTGYEGPATLVEGESGVYAATDWYWPNNKTFYHFRTVMPTGHAVTEDAVNGDYMTLTGADAYTDVCWGAPFTQDGKISKAIGPTKNTINLVLSHMMSEVTIELTTSDGDDAVMLSGALMELSGIYPTGIVRMGDGTVTPTGTPESVNNMNQVPWTHGFVPQSLDGVVLTITTGDHNQYLVTMKDVLADGNNKPISEWKPGHKYTYTFKLAKTGITQMSATLKDWVEVTGGNDNVQIQ